MTRREIRRAMRECPCNRARQVLAKAEPMKAPGAWLAERRARRAEAVSNTLLYVLAVLALALMFAGNANCEAYTVQTDGGRLNVREKPWVGAPVAGTLDNGDQVDVVSIADGWALVNVPVEAGEGYVSMDYLSCDKQEPGMYKVDECGRVRVRKEPGGKRVRWLESGESVKVERWQMENGVLWAFVGDGYVLGDMLVEAEP